MCLHVTHVLSTGVIVFSILFLFMVCPYYLTDSFCIGVVALFDAPINFFFISSDALSHKRFNLIVSRGF